MRARNIKPGFFKNDELAALPPLTRILFQGLWCYADHLGNLEDRPARIKIEILPYDHCNVVAMLDELEQAGFVRRYAIDGARYLHIPKFLKHQNPHKNERLKGTKIPPPVRGEVAENNSQEGAYEQSVTEPFLNGIDTGNEAACDFVNKQEARTYSGSIKDENGSRHADSGFPIPESGLQYGSVDDSTREPLSDLWDGETLTAPVLAESKKMGVSMPVWNLPMPSSPRHAFQMAPGWSPDETFSERLEFAGCVAAPDFWKECLPEFVLYREATGERKTQAQWEHKFLQDVLHKFAKFKTQNYQNAPIPLPESWSPSGQAWAVLEQRGIDRSFVRDRLDEFVLFWRDDGGARRSWNALFVDYVQRRWDEKAVDRSSTWESLNDISWAEEVCRPLQLAGDSDSQGTE